MKFSAAAVILCLASFSAAQNYLAHNAAPNPPVTLMKGLGDLHHPVSTKNAEAQQFFDQGLRLIYAFNHDEAGRSFPRAAELDPQLAMAYWGIAEAVGPNYNDPAGFNTDAALRLAFTPQSFKTVAGKTASSQARRLLPSGPASSGQRARLQQDMETSYL